MKFFLPLVLVFSTDAFAISNGDLSAQCFEVGREKIAQQAEAYGCGLDANQTEVQSIDNRWYNPSKYVWYQVDGACEGQDHLTVLVQYSEGKCF